MKMRTLVILLLVLGLLAGASALLLFHSGWSPQTAKVQGDRLLEELPVNEVAFLTVASSHNTTTVAKKEDGWIVKERSSYPADFGKIVNLVRALKETTIRRQFTGSDETLRRLALKDPDDPAAADTEKGLLLILKDQKQKILVSILLDRQQKDHYTGQEVPGRYVRLSNDSTVYLIDERFITVSEDPKTWLDSFLFKVHPEEIKSISCISTSDDTILYRFARSEKEEKLQAVAGTLASKPINQLSLNKLTTSLQSMKIVDVVQPTTDSVTAVQFPYRFDYELFNGTTYRIYLGKENPIPEPCELRLTVEYNRPQSGKELAPASDETAIEAKKLNERMSHWLYLVSSSQYRTFMTDPDQLVIMRQTNRPSDKSLPLQMPTQ
ncbi:MAG TPA: DUF4340 domain-containing protein [Syntrophales bacterium]|nr:DUF4340 domain-containing protein [Syntrophales bacterium]